MRYKIPLTVLIIVTEEDSGRKVLYLGDLCGRILGVVKYIWTGETLVVYL